MIESIENRYRYFGAGGARGFDTVATMAVLELKKIYPDIRLILVLPCRNQTRGWKEADIQKYEWIKSNVNATNFRLVEIGAFYDPNLTESDYSKIAYTDVNGSLTTNVEDLIIVRKVLLEIESDYNIDANHDDFCDIRDLVALKNSLI